MYVTHSEETHFGAFEIAWWVRKELAEYGVAWELQAEHRSLLLTLSQVTKPSIDSCVQTSFRESVVDLEASCDCWLE